MTSFAKFDAELNRKRNVDDGVNIYLQADSNRETDEDVIEMQDVEEDELNSKTKRSDYTWVSSYNFMCLLNLPETIDYFGPILLYYEGGPLGEKNVQTIKRLFPGFIKDWPMATLKKVDKKETLKKMGIGQTSTKEYLPKMANPFKTEKELTGLLEKNLPFTGVFIAGQYYVLFQPNAGEKKLIKLSIGMHQHTRSIFDYYEVSVELDGEYTVLDYFAVDEFCTFLPYLVMDGIPERGSLNSYAIISSNWKTF